MSFQQYPPLHVLVNGEHQLQLHNVSIEFQSGLNPVHTIDLGLAGFSQGSKFTTIMFDSAVPQPGLEFDFTEAILNNDDVKLQVDFGSNSYVGTGKVLNGTAQAAVDQHTTANMHFMCEFQKLQ